MRTRANPRLLRRDGSEYLPTVYVLKFGERKAKKALLNQIHNDKEKKMKKGNKNRRGTTDSRSRIQIVRQ